MNSFFISEERLARQAYRYDFRYRFAALFLITAIGLQLPFLVLIYHLYQVRNDEEVREGLSLQRKGRIQTELAKLHDTQILLRTIRNWEPLLRSRMSASALIGAVERTVPKGTVLSRLEIDGAKYYTVPLPGGCFQVPGAYLITLEGEAESEGSWNQLRNSFLGKLPPGSKIVETRIGSQRDTPFIECRCVFQAEANGNYHSLDIAKIEVGESL
ncbi:MAG: hypothetical protein JO076_04085 [Verrucomicrobia bacterium]|nr:hypothetical protein [Verrucomicrobiota bacterium]